MGYSEYDPRVVFDDVEGFGGGGSAYYVGGDEQPRRDPLAAAGAILRRARSRHKRRRVGARPVIGVTDTTRRTFRPRLRQVLGADSVNTPVFQSLVQKFSQGVPDPKLARIDDVQSYADFRAERRAPYIAQLEQRLAALEFAFQQHVANNEDPSVWLNVELRRILSEAACGGEPIALPVPEVRSGQIECWRDGDEILCTVRVLSPAGVRMVTSGTPIAGHANEVATCAVAEGITRDEVLGGAGAAATNILGAAKLVEEVCEAAPELVQCCGGRPGTVLGVVPAADPVMAASMSLLQKCQQGDWTAVADARRLMSERPRLVREAGRRLTTAQRLKAQGRLQ